SPPLLPISCPYPLPFSVPPPRPHRDLPSFPTRRSSDLRGVIAELSADELRATSHRWINRLGWLIEWNDATGFSLDRLFVSMPSRSEEHTSEFQSRFDLVCRLLLEKKKRCVQICSPRDNA